VAAPVVVAAAAGSAPGSTTPVAAATGAATALAAGARVGMMGAAGAREGRRGAVGARVGKRGAGARAGGARPPRPRAPPAVAAGHARHASAVGRGAGAGVVGRFSWGLRRQLPCSCRLGGLGAELPISLPG
jgi:hypothetical protein